MAETSKSDYLSVGEYAEMKDISTKTVRKRIHDGRLPAENFGTEKRPYWKIHKEAKIKTSSNQKVDSVPKVTIPLEERKTEISLEEFDKIHLRRASMSKKKMCWNYGYGAVRIRLTKDGIERWYYQLWVEKNGKRIRIEKIIKHARNREEAVLELEKVHQEYLEGRFNKEERIQFKDLAEKYVNYAEGINKKSLSSDRSYLYQKNGLVSFFGGMWIHEISSFHIAGYKKLRQNGMVTNTTNLHLSLLRRMLNLAKRWKIKLGDEVQNIVNPEEHFDRVPERKRVLTDEEEEKLFKELSSKLQRIVIIALNTGMRKMEILSLEWKDADLDKREVLIITEKSKTEKERRIPLNDEALKSFQALKVENGSSQYVFPSSNSKTEYMTGIQKPFKLACKKAEIKNLHFHDLRRTFGTRLHYAHVPLYHIMLLLGHSDLKTTQRYLRLKNEEDLKGAVSVLDKPKSSVESVCNGKPMAVSENIVSLSTSIS